MNARHSGVSLSECTCRTWSSCMHMNFIRMWLSIAQPQVTKCDKMCTLQLVCVSFWINAWHKNTQNKSCKWFTEECMLQTNTKSYSNSLGGTCSSLPQLFFISEFFFFCSLVTSGNRTLGNRSYSDLLDTWTDSVCIHQLVLKPHSKAACIM